jgi:hypothetical protein
MVFLVLHRETNAYPDQSRFKILGAFEKYTDAHAFLFEYFQKTYPQAIQKEETSVTVTQLFDQTPLSPKTTYVQLYYTLGTSTIRVRDDQTLRIVLSVEKWAVQ